MRHAAALLLVMLLISACISESYAAAANTPKATFVKDVNSICAAANSGIRSIKRPTTLQGVAAAGKRILEIARRLYAALVGVKPPSSDADRYRKMLSLLAKENAAGSLQQHAFALGQFRRVTEIGHTIDAISARFNRLATTLGLRECAKNVEPSA